MAKYLILIYGDEAQWDARTAEQDQALGDGHRAFRAAAGEGLLGAGELEAASTATTLRGATSGRATPTDGPFLETKEALGGFYEIEAPDLDAAITLAHLLPETREGHAAVEIRPLVGRR